MATTTQPLHARDPHRVGPYALLGRLGTVALGTVFLARSTEGRAVALTVLDDRWAFDRHYRARFAADVAAARAVTGPRVAPVVDGDPNAARPWLATTHLPCPSLADLVMIEGPVPVDRLLPLAEAVAGALARVHAAGVTQRDLSPAQVLIAADGPHLTGFGIAPPVDLDLATRAASMPTMTAYLAPEQVGGQPPTYESDMFALGGVLYFAATGEAPFGIGPASTVLTRIVRADCDLGRIDHPLLAEFVTACLVPDPRLRPSAAEIADRARQALGIVPEATTPDAASGTGIPAPVDPAPDIPAPVDPVDSAGFPPAPALPPTEPGSSPVPDLTRAPETATLQPRTPAAPSPPHAAPPQASPATTRPAPATGTAGSGVPGHAGPEEAEPRSAAGSPRPSPGSRILAVAVAAAVLITAGALAWLRIGPQAAKPAAARTTSTPLTMPTPTGTADLAGPGAGPPTLAASRAVLTGHTGHVFAVAYDPRGTLVATVGADRTARLWDAATGESVRTLTMPTPSPVAAVAFSPDGRLLATGGRDGRTLLWNVTTGKLTRSLKTHTGEVSAVAFSPDGRLLATAGQDRSARLWNVATGKRTWVLSAHAAGLTGIAFAPDGTLLATSSEDGTAQLWRTRTGRPVRSVGAGSGALTAVTFAPDGTTLITAGRDRTARSWTVATGAPVRTFEGHTSAVLAVAVSPDGALLVTAGEDATVRLWDLATGAASAVLTAHTSPVRGAAVSPDGRGLATVDDDGTARQWDLPAR